MVYNTNMKPKKKMIFKLDKILEERGLSVMKFAEQTKLNRSTVSRIYHNHSSGITLDLLLKITEALNITPNDLIETVIVKSEEKYEPESKEG